MPTLIVEQPGKRTGGRMKGRVLIGRLPTNGIVVSDSSVSRLHAWIDLDLDDHYYVADSGSLTGTWVNGRAIEKRRLLGDGDVIRTGQAQIVFSLEEELPEGVDWIDLAGQPAGENIDESGVLFDCACGAPIWFKAAAVGQSHVCRHCGQTIQIPEKSGSVAKVVGPAQIVEPGMPPLHGVTSASMAHDVYAQKDVSAGEESSVHPIDEHGLTESVAGTAVLENGVAEAPVAEREPLFEPHAELAAVEAEHDPLFAPLPDPEILDPSAHLLTEALQTHGEYSVEPPMNGESLPAFEGEGEITEIADESGITDETPEAAPEELPVEEYPAEPEPISAEVIEETTAVAEVDELPPAPVVESAPIEEPSPIEEPVPIEELAFEPVPERSCSICHSAIVAGEISTACPACGLTFHADCWEENLGCSAYGCSQVGILKQPEVETAEAESLAETPLDEEVTAPVEDEELEVAGFPWESAFLFFSVVGSLMGAIAYGVPAVIGALGTAIYLFVFQESRKRRIFAIVALLVCVLGAGGGVYVSYLYWNGWPPVFDLRAHHGRRL